MPSFIFSIETSLIILKLNFLVVDSRARESHECDLTLKTGLGEIFLLLFLAHGRRIAVNAHARLEDVRKL